MAKDKREPIEIKMDICEFLYNYGPVKVTKIEHACNLRDDLCKQYLTELIDLQFARKNENDEYDLMERGIDFVTDTMNLYLTHFPERMKKIEGERFWVPIKRLPRRMKEAAATDSTLL